MSRQKQHCTGLCRMGVLLVILLSATAAVQAAEPPAPPTVINIGEAEVFAAIGQVEFRFIRHFIGATLEESVTQCQTFLEAAPQAIRGSELQPLEIKNSPPEVTSIADHQTRAIVTVRFGMAAFNAAKTGPVQFAALCDKLAGVAETMKATLSSPKYYPADKDAVEAGVIARATEQAYLPAEAVAVAVKSSIFAIDKVEILELEWEQQPDEQVNEVPQMRCRARVQVVYVLGAQ